MANLPEQKKEKERKKRETDNSSLSAPCTIHSDCSLTPYTPPPTLKTARRGLYDTAGLLTNFWSKCCSPLYLLPIPSLNQWITQRVWLKCCPLPSAVTKSSRMFFIAMEVLMQVCRSNSISTIYFAPLIQYWHSITTKGGSFKLVCPAYFTPWASAVQVTAM